MRTIFALLLSCTAALAQNAAEIYGTPPELPDWASKFASCTCIKNIDGACMTFGSGPYPYRQYDEGISGPHCTTGCFPGFSDIYGWTVETKRELAACHIDWKRVRHEQGRDNSPQWQ